MSAAVAPASRHERRSGWARPTCAGGAGRPLAGYPLAGYPLDCHSSLAFDFSL